MKVLSGLRFHLVDDERGSLLPVFALLSTIVVASVAGAIDFGRAYRQRSLMQNSLDAAILSGLGAYGQSSDWSQATSRAQSSFNGYYGSAATITSAATSTSNGVTSTTYTVDTKNADGTHTVSSTTSTPTVGTDVPLVQFTNDGSVLTGTASMTAYTPFVHMVIGQNLTLTATSSASLSSSGSSTPSRNSAEVAMMIDLTGSMGQSVNGTTKIAALQSAGVSLLDILLPNDGTNDSYVKVGIAPFADFVNAGSYASAVTGLSATGGAYANITNLASTRQGVFSGTYSGLIAGNGGSQAGATPPSANSGTGSGTTTVSGAVTAGGGTYTNQYCAVPTQSTTSIATMTANIPNSRGIATSTSAQIGTASNSQNGYNSGGYNNNVVQGAYFWQSGNTWYYLSQVGTQNGEGYGYWYQQQTNGSWILYYAGNQYNNSNTIPNQNTRLYYNAHVPTTTTVTTTVAGCESQTVVPSGTTSKLISCVTERVNSSAANDYTASAPGASSEIGAYNHGQSSISNYSSDGKCYVAGRELAPVIPLTNDKSTLEAFFNGPSSNGPLIGGGTPGHLGTAWAWYLLSPSWSSIWPSTSTPVAYNSTTTKKYAILMTDGEYNEQYAGPASATQALSLCTAMKAQGITVITIGFGYAVNAVSQAQPSATGTTEQRAMYTLQQCATQVSAGQPVNYYFPYDAAALQQTFASIGATVVTQTSTNVVRQGGRLTQ